MHSFLEKELLPTIANVSDITRNFHILIAANQPTFQLFELNTIRRMRLQLMYPWIGWFMDRQGMTNDIQLVAASVKKKLYSTDNQIKSNTKYKTIIDNLVKSINQKLLEIKGMGVSFC